MAYLEKETFPFVQNLNFHTKLMKFVLGLIPSFDAKISGMNTTVDEYPSIPR